MVESQPRTGLRGFMDRGGVGAYLALVIPYLVIYVGSSRVFEAFAGHYDTDPLLSSAGSVFFQVTAPLILGAVLLLGFASYMGWTQALFARQTVYRSWWMWLGPIIVLLPIVFRVLGISWGAHPAAVVVSMMLTGLLIGFVEELLYRGFGVKMLRDGRHGESFVAVVSSLIFALSHLSNLVGGQSISTVAPTVLFTFAFGALMYLTLRSLRFLVWAMLLHGLTDPTTILATGGIDTVGKGAGTNTMLTLAGTVTFILIAAGIILLFFVRGRSEQAGPGKHGDHDGRTADEPATV